MRYEDFVIHFAPGDGQDFLVRVQESPAGQGSSRFQLPCRPEEIREVTAWMESQVRRDRDVRSSRRRRLPWQEVREFGGRLFEGVFSGPVRDRFIESLGAIGKDPNLGLRIRLKLDPRDPAMMLLSSLPWEFLFRPETEDFLALASKTSIVRDFEIARGNVPAPVRPPLRILVAISDAIGDRRLDVESERRNIERAWGRNQRNVEVVFLENVTLTSLRVKFQERPFHVFHYIGHGGVHDDSEEGVLYFHGPDERPQPVTGRALATTLKPFRDNLDLVFLNGCHTARDGGATRHDPFTGVATALILGGVPAVLAMQFPITDEAAIEFSDELYRRLAAGEALEAAVTEGRQKVHAEHPESMEWGTPVLFMRTPIDVSTGRGFTLARVSKAGALWLGASLLALAIGGFILFPANGARRDCRFSSLELDLANVGSRRWFEGDDIRLKAEELALNSLMGRVKFAGEDGLEECSCRWFALPRREVTSTGEPCGFSISPSPKETFDLRLLVDGRYSRIFTIRVENSKHLQIPGNRPTMPTVGYLQVATVRKRDGTSTDLSEGDVIEVIPEKALLYTRPSIDSDTRTLLGSGATARILKQVDDWIEVELYDSIEKGNQNEKTEGR